MKKIFLCLTIICGFSLFAFSQIDTKKTNFYLNTDIGGAKSIYLSVKNPVSRFNFAKLEFVIDNQSTDFVFFQQGDVIFKYQDGEYKPDANRSGLVIRPVGKKSPTLKIDNGKEFLANEFTIIPGGLYTFPEKGTPVTAEDFHLPATKNVFEAGNFKVTMLKLKKETDETAVQFECLYTGTDVGLVSPVNASIRTEDGTLWANVRTGDKTDVLFKGDRVKFTVIYRIPGKFFDMQFAQMDIVWEGVFSETQMTPVDFPSAVISIDEIKTAEKNK